jgi:RNA polymerase sigma factor (sigma-70 family)
VASGTKHDALELIAVIRAQVRCSRARRFLKDFLEDDLVQDILLHLLENGAARLNKYDPERGELATYLRTVARSRLADLVRKEIRRRQTGMKAELDTDACERAADGRDPEARILDRLCANCVFKCLDEGMTRREREVFLLFFGEGRSYQDIATKLSTTESVVTSRIRAVRQRAEECKRRCTSDPSSPSLATKNGERPCGRERNE